MSKLGFISETNFDQEEAMQSIWHNLQPKCIQLPP